MTISDTSEGSTLGKVYLTIEDMMTTAVQENPHLERLRKWRARSLGMFLASVCVALGCGSFYARFGPSPGLSVILVVAVVIVVTTIITSFVLEARVNAVVDEMSRS